MPVTARPIPTANVPSGTAFLAASSDRCARCAIGSCCCVDRSAGRSGPGIDVTAYPVVHRRAACGGVDPPARGSHASMSTRTLILLAAVTGLAILAAGAIQILLAR